jgi:Gas vesicle synthesis protein GvpL/GvpF
MTDEARCVWLYAVTADGAGLPAGDAAGPIGAIGGGVGGGRVRAVRAAGLTAVVEDVDEDEFGEAGLRRNLEDLDWLERTARAHHAVIGALAGRGPVVPMRLATVYSGDEPVADTLRRRAGDLREALVRLSGRSEWGVKAYTAAPAGPGPGPHGRADGATGPGAAYLQRRRAQLSSRANARQVATTGAEAVHAELSRLSVSARLYPLQPPRLAGQTAPMVLNAAYLVADERAGEFAAAVHDLTVRHQSVRLGLTGPWPAYSFAGDSGTSGEGR